MSAVADQDPILDRFKVNYQADWEVTDAGAVMRGELTVRVERCGTGDYEVEVTLWECSLTSTSKPDRLNWVVANLLRDVLIEAALWMPCSMEGVFNKLFSEWPDWVRDVFSETFPSAAAKAIEALGARRARADLLGRLSDMAEQNA